MAAFVYFALVFALFQLLYNVGKARHEAKLRAQKS